MNRNEFGVYIPEVKEHDENDIYREAILNEWFQEKKSFYKNSVDKKTNNVSIVIQSPLLVRIFDTMYKKYRRNYSEREECIFDCISYTWEALKRFEPKDMTWEYLATHNDRETRNKLMSYVRNIVTSAMRKQNVKAIETTKTLETKEGKKSFHLYYSLDVSSLNIMINPSHSNYETELVQIVEESYWTAKKEYQFSRFIQWFLDNRENILNENQRSLLAKLEWVNYSSLDKDYDLSEVGLTTKNLNSKLRKIYEKVEKEYKRQEKFIDGGFVIESIDKEIASLKKILNPIYNDDIDNEKVNLEVSKRIIQNLSEPAVERIVYDVISPNTAKQIVLVYGSSMVADSKRFSLRVGNSLLGNKAIYEVVNAIEERIEFLQEQKKTELELLEKIKNEMEKVPVINYIEPPKDGSKSIYMVLNSYGVLIPNS